MLHELLLLRIMTERENVNGFVFKRRRPITAAGTGQVAAAIASSNRPAKAPKLGAPMAPSVSAATKTGYGAVGGVVRLQSDSLPAYPGTKCPPSVRGEVLQDSLGNGSVYEQDAQRLLKLLQNIGNEEMATINASFPAEGPHGHFNLLASSVYNEFLTRAQHILVSSAKQTEMRDKANAPYLKPLPANEHMRARKSVLISLVDKFEREKLSWKKAQVANDPDHESDRDADPMALSVANDDDGGIVVEEQAALSKAMTESIKKMIVQVDQIYEVLDKSRKSGESLEKRRRELSAILHATAHYTSGTTKEVIEGFTSTSQPGRVGGGQLIRAFTQNLRAAVSSTGGLTERSSSNINNSATVISSLIRQDGPSCSTGDGATTGTVSSGEGGGLFLNDENSTNHSTALASSPTGEIM